MSFLSKLRGGGSPHYDVVTNDLKRLDNVKLGLGEQAIAYVLAGADGTVLASLNALCKANELEVCRTYVDGRSNATLGRRKLFAQGDPYDLAMFQRYTEVLGSAASGIPGQTQGAIRRNR